jgi:hypothetical protein
MTSFIRQYINGFKPSAEYRAWRREFMGSRLQLGLWLAIVCHLMFAASDLYKYVIHPDPEAIQQAISLFGTLEIYDRLKQLILLTNWVAIGLLIGCLLIWQTAWGRRRPKLIFLAITWSITLEDV